MQKVPGISLYHQIKQDMRVHIEKLMPGEKLETEQQLTLRYGVSRGTVRQAIGDLAAEGLVVKIQGSGTFRADTHKLNQSYFVNKSYTQQILDAGRVPGISNVSLKEAAANTRVAKHLAIPEGTPVFKLARMRLMDNLPFGYAVAHLRKDLLPGLTANDLELSLISMLENKFGLTLVNRRSSCTAISASGELSRLLPVKMRAPILQIESTAETLDECPMFLDTTYLTSNFTLVLEEFRMQ